MNTRLATPDPDGLLAIKPAVVRKSPAAFTLIEMLVVVGIITALIAILIPVLIHSAAAGRKATCMTRQRAISQQIDGFVVDSFMRFPNQTEIGDIFQGLSVDDPEDDNPFLMPGEAIGQSSDMLMSYAFNIEFMARGVAMTQITHVSTTLLLYDGFAASVNGSGESYGHVHSENKNKVAVLHKPASPAAKILHLPISALGAHLKHGDLVGSWDDVAKINCTNLTLSDFDPRHPVGEPAGAATFVDGHAEFRQKLDASMFMDSDSDPTGDD